MNCACHYTCQLIAEIVINKKKIQLFYGYKKIQMKEFRFFGIIFEIEINYLWSG